MTATATATERAVVATLGRIRVLPVLSFSDVGHVAETCEALIAGGVSCVEITFRTRVAAEAIAVASRIDGFLVGAGTVLEVDQLRAAARAGARFAVAPGLNETVVMAAHELGLPFFPGVATASEIDHARRLGCRTLKVFPAATVGGPAFLNAVAASYPDLRFIPTGGIDTANLRDYLAVPSVLACGGTWLGGRRLIDDRRFDEIERLARVAIQEAG